ncbi:LysR substrate-binding domain-containing protein [Testudinibacter sp. P27/CKL/0425]
MQVPAILVKQALADGSLVQLLTEVESISLPLSIMYPNRQYLAPQVRVFVDWMIETVQEINGLD